MNLKRSLALALSLLLVLSVMPVFGAGETLERISGANRWATAVEISQEGWDSASVVVLANGRNYPDALAAVPLAYALDAPILLTEADELVEEAEDEIERLGATKVIIVGGTGVISEDVADALEALDLDVERISGADRYATAAAIAAEVAPNGADTVVLAYGRGYADALAAASYAAVNGYPILLTEKNELPEATEDAIEDLGATKVIVVGGTGVIAAGTVADLPGVTRVSGANREATSVALAEHFAPDTDMYYLATGDGFADAITGAVLAAKNGTGILLVRSSLSTEVGDFLADVSELVVFGGTGAVSTAVANAAKAKLAGAPVASEFGVQKVEWLNARQIQVTYSERPGAAATTVTGYKLDNADLPTGTAFRRVGSVVTITLPEVNALVNKATYVFQVNPMAPYADPLASSDVFVTTKYFMDTTAPVITSMEAWTNGAAATSVRVYFSEPIKTGSIKINGVHHTVAPTIDGTTVYQDFSQPLSATSVHKLEAIQLTDFAGTTPNSIAYATHSFSVTVDKVRPVVEKVEPYGDNYILVTFSKDMDFATMDFTQVTTANRIKLKNEALNDVAFTEVAATLDDAVYLIGPITDSLYDNTSTRNLTLVFNDTIKDWLGNKLVAGTKVVTLTEDTAKPAVTDITFTRDGSKNVDRIILHFNEDIALPVSSGATVNRTMGDLLIVDKDGRLVDPTTYFNGNGTVDDNKLIFTATTLNQINNKWTITVPASLVTDTAQNPNSSTSFSKTLDMTVAASAEVVTLAANAVAVDGTDPKHTFTVTYPQAVKGGAVAGSATDRLNYSINGMVLPEGTLITLNGTQTVATIVLPTGSIATSDGNALFRVNNVQTVLRGTTITPHLQQVAITDNTKPVLLSARMIDNVTIELTYNENMKSLSSVDVSAAFTIKQDDVILVLGTGETLVASSVPGYDKKIRIVLGGTTFDLDADITVKALNSSAVQDVAQNNQTANTVVDVVK